MTLRPYSKDIPAKYRGKEASDVSLEDLVEGWIAATMSAAVRDGFDGFMFNAYSIAEAFKSMGMDVPIHVLIPHVVTVTGRFGYAIKTTGRDMTFFVELGDSKGSA